MRDHPNFRGLTVAFRSRLPQLHRDLAGFGRELAELLEGAGGVASANAAEARGGVERARLRVLLTGLIMVSLVTLLALRAGGAHPHRGNPQSPFEPESKVAACRT